jgi:hypothetical protein
MERLPAFNHFDLFAACQVFSAGKRFFIAFVEMTCFNLGEIENKTYRFYEKK